MQGNTRPDGRPDRDEVAADAEGLFAFPDGAIGMGFLPHELGLAPAPPWHADGRADAPQRRSP